MKLPRRNFLHLVAGAAALPAVSCVAWAQAYPTRPVRIIVPFSAGGPFDIVVRPMAQWLADRLGQQFVIDNRPGAGGNIGTEAVVRAPADGYTLRRRRLIAACIRRVAENHGRHQHDARAVSWCAACNNRPYGGPSTRRVHRSVQCDRTPQGRQANVITASTPRPAVTRGSAPARSRQPRARPRAP
jgi:Tripartite tricarboxylate transporter family receptor